MRQLGTSEPAVASGTATAEEDKAFPSAEVWVELEESPPEELVGEGTAAL